MILPNISSMNTTTMAAPMPMAHTAKTPWTDARSRGPWARVLEGGRWQPPLKLVSF